MRCFSRIRWWCTAAVSSSDGIGAYTSSLLRSLSTTMRAPSAIALLTSVRIASRARFNASPPPATRYRPLTTTAASSGYGPPHQVGVVDVDDLGELVVVDDRERQRQLPAALRAGREQVGLGADRGPPTEVTTSSRMASSGGLVTWANNCWK